MFTVVQRLVETMRILAPIPGRMGSSRFPMMRVLEQSHDVRMLPTAFESQPVDTEADLAKVERLMQGPW